MSGNKFTNCRELVGFNLPTNVLTFSMDAKYLVSGGDDEKVRLWDTRSSKCIQVLENESWGQITVLTWVCHEPRTSLNNTWLCVGTGRGNVSLYPYSYVSVTASTDPVDTERGVSMAPFSLNDAVECMAFDHQNSRLVLASHSGLLKMYTVQTSPPSFQELWSTRLAGTVPAIPRAVFFFGGGHQSLLAMCLETAEMICYQAQNHEKLWQKTLAGAIGSAALSDDEKVILVDNLSTGLFDVYELPSQTPVQSLQPASRRKFTRQGIFLEGSKHVVCGSTTNEIRVINAFSGSCIQILKTPRGMLQAVAASTVRSNRHLIAAASGSDPVIYLWEKLIPDESRESRNDPARRATQRDDRAVDNPVNGQIMLLVLVCTYSQWSPYLYRFLTFVAEKVRGILGTYGI